MKPEIDFPTWATIVVQGKKSIDEVAQQTAAETAVQKTRDRGLQLFLFALQAPLNQREIILNGMKKK